MFKVGDKVRVIGGGWDWINSTMDKFIGLETKIIDITDVPSYKVEGGDNWHFYDDSLELIEKPITIPLSVFSKQEQMLIEVAKSSGIELNVDVDSMTYAPTYAKFDNIIGCLVYDGKTLQFGGARCNPTDEFDDKFGRGLAFGRAILGVE